MLVKAWVTLLSIATVVVGHSHLANPLPTRRLDCRVGNGRARDCPGPCPPMDTYGDPTGVTASRPTATWRRGEARTVTWHRNNHGNGESGFVRLTLVPVDKMMNKEAHARFTFQISCWSSGLHRCPSRNIHVCGNDAEGKSYSVRIKVPTSYPDGVYVMGWAWYGGGDYKGKSFFGDYYSCSFVRIRGGAGPTSEWRPVFVPGDNQKHTTGCISATDRVGACPREPCHVGRVGLRKPVNLPRVISNAALGGQASSQKKPGSNQASLNSRGKASFNMQGLQILDVRSKKSYAINGKTFTVRTGAYRKGFTLGLRTSGRVTSVRFDMRGYSHTELYIPYIINGNDGQLTAFKVCQKGRTLDIDVTVTGIRLSKQYRFKMKCG